MVGRSSDQFPLRLPDGMRERIKSAASANQRSMNAEIVAALEERFPNVDSFETTLARAERLYQMRDRARNEEEARAYDGALERALGELSEWIRGWEFKGY